MKQLLAGVVFLATGFVLWGIGEWVRRKAGARGGPRMVSIGVGLAALVFVGGILNLAHVAYGPVLWVVAGIGLVLAILEFKRVRPQLTLDRRGWIEVGTAAAVIVPVIAFAVATQLPPRVFNAADDFQKYFCHPVRMLETGTLLGSPLGGLGSQTLGGQAYLQGFVLSVLPIGYINGMDAVFGLMILMVLGAAAGWWRYGRFPGAMIGPLMIAAVNPNYANVSALYLGAVLMATAVMLVAEDREDAPSPLVLGLVYAALVVLKSSFAPFVMVHAAFSVLAMRARVVGWKPAFVWGVRAGVLAAVFAAPWIVLHLPNYLAKGSFGPVAATSGDEGEFNLFSVKQLYYGASFAHYTLVAGLVAVTAVCALVCVRFETDRRRRAVAAAVAAAAATGALCYLAFVCVLGPRWSGYLAGLRYSIPTTLGCGVFAIVMLPTLPLRLPRGSLIATGVLSCVVVVGAFVPSMVARYRQAVKSGSVLAFSQLAEFPAYIHYSEYCLSPEAAARVRSLQEKIPAGQPVLAWIGAPFHLDYRRNPIVNPESGGMVTPWAHVPDNVRYVLWQYRDQEGFEGFGVTGINDYEELMSGPGKQDRVIAARSLAFMQHIQGLAAKSRVITNDGQTVLFEIGNEPAK